jgi:hypothetical protein
LDNCKFRCDYELSLKTRNDIPIVGEVDTYSQADWVKAVIEFSGTEGKTKAVLTLWFKIVKLDYKEEPSPPLEEYIFLKLDEEARKRCEKPMRLADVQK